MIALLGVAGLGRDAPLFAAALIMLPCIAIMRGLRSRAAGVQPPADFRRRPWRLAPVGL